MKMAEKGNVVENLVDDIRDISARLNRNQVRGLGRMDRGMAVTKSKHFGLAQDWRQDRWQCRESGRTEVGLI